jgi:hypothetical protein
MLLNEAIRLVHRQEQDQMEAKLLPYRLVGSHRRVNAEDLMAYRQTMQVGQANALKPMTVAPGTLCNPKTRPQRSHRALLSTEPSALRTRDKPAEHQGP